MNKDAKSSTSTKTGWDSKTAPASRSKANRDAENSRLRNQQRIFAAHNIGEKGHESRHRPQVDGQQQQQQRPGGNQKQQQQQQQGGFRSGERRTKLKPGGSKPKQGPGLTMAGGARASYYLREMVEGTAAYRKAKERIDTESCPMLPRFYDNDQSMREAMKFCMQRYKVQQNKHSEEHRDTLIDFQMMKQSFFDPFESETGRDTIRHPAASTFVPNKSKSMAIL